MCIGKLLRDIRDTKFSADSVRKLGYNQRTDEALCLQDTLGFWRELNERIYP